MVKKQITVVNLTEGRDAVEPENEAPNNDEVEQLNQIKEEIKKEDIEKEITNPEDIPKDIPKKKAAPRKKKEVVEEQPPTAPPTPKEKQAEEIKPARKVKTVELVSCPKCKKEMTKRTLRYDHEKTCPGEPIVRESVPVKRRPVSKKENETPAQPINIPDELIEQEVKKRMQNTSQDRMQQKIKLKEDRIKKLATQIA